MGKIWYRNTGDVTQSLKACPSYYSDEPQAICVAHASIAQGPIRGSMRGAEPGGGAKIQMANRWGFRSIQHQAG